MSLPIFSCKSQIIEGLLKSQVLIVTGEPGCGKSTQLPQFCLDSKELRKKLHCTRVHIAVTQPRRVATIAMAKRVAYERSVRLGEEVGYSIRFEDVTSKHTTIKFLTDGVLLRESITQCFCAYDVVILDEAHERSLDTDILIGLLKTHVAKHRHFRLIVTSATIDVSLFSKYFDNCPVITIPGREYPIEILHSSCKLDKRVEYTVNAALRIHLHEGPGDILAFLTGSDECERAKSRCFEALQQLEAQGTPVASMIILALYGAMSSEEQSQVFHPTPEDCRKVIFSTNISETSITVDGIGFVIDCGYVKQKQQNTATGLEALMVVPISKQQAKQRAGRAGRTTAGKCFRLYSEAFYMEQMAESQQAEILRSSLASVVLTLKTLGVKSVVEFNYLESPDERAVVDAMKQLFYVGAIDESGNVTAVGREMCRFPIHPGLARCLISSIETDCAEEMIQMVSILSTENIWRSVPKADTYMLESLRKVQSDFARPDGDHITLLKIYQSWLDSNKSPRFCSDNFLNLRAMRQADDIKHQIRNLMKEVNLPRLPEADLLLSLRDELQTSELRVRLSLCLGFYMNAAREIELGQAGSYMTVKDNCVLHVDRSSSISILGSFPKWIIFTELSGSNLIHGTMKAVSRVKGKWLKSLVPKLEDLDIEKLLGRISVKRPFQETPESFPINPENLQSKLTQAKERYLKRKGHK